MRTRVLQWVGTAILGAGIAVPAARAGEPVAGVDLGAALPLSTFRRTVNEGGTIAPFAGYRFGNRTVSFMPLVQLNYTAFGTGDINDGEEAPNGGEGSGGTPSVRLARRSGDVTDLFAVGGGARLALHDENVEVFFQTTGSWYKNFFGALKDDHGEGFSFGGGVNYEFGFLPRGMALGLYIRRDQANIDAAADSDRNLSYLTTGLSLRHRFIPPEPLPVLAEAPPPPAPREPAVAKKIVLRGVNFDFDKATLRPDAKPILDEAVRTLKEEASLQISIEGHTDGTGTDAYNQGLSERRAAAVRDYLAAAGIDPGRLTVVGYGESRPVASNDTDDGRAQNRRVELRVKE
jgi:outer membrane protein OmpA-like peptidoglycan-associated protein